jgi:hypothetical protein
VPGHSPRHLPRRLRRSPWRSIGQIARRHVGKTIAGLAAALIPVIALLFGAALPPEAAAWANGDRGGNGFGTHDWVLVEADRLARAAGAGWLQLTVALPRTDDPDTLLHDSYHHVYDVSGDPYGDAPDRIAQLYDRAVKQLRRGSRRAASASFGLLAHYYADICNPLHTDQMDLEERIHSGYEDAVEWRTDTRGERRGWVRPDGVKVRVSAVVAARAAAASGNVVYGRLVRQYAAHGFNAPVSTITRRGLSRAVNDLADLLLSVRNAAR